MMNWERFWHGVRREEAGADGASDGTGSAAPIGDSSDASAASHFDDVIDNYLGRGGDEPAAPAVEPPAPAPTPAATPPPAATPGVGQPPVVPTPVAAPTQAIPQAAPATVTAQPPASLPAAQPPQPQPTDPTQRWQAARQAAVGDFERSLSNFSEQDVVALMTEPHKVLPRFGAELGMAVFDMTLRSVMTMLPQVISAHQNHGRAEEQAHAEFYGMYPQLRQHPQGLETLYRVGPAYNHANAGRQIDGPTRMREIGEIVCRSLGLDPTPQNVQAAAAAVTAPGTPNQSQPSPVPILPPPVPAGLGGAAAPPSVHEPQPWDDILHLRRH